MFKKNVSGVKRPDTRAHDQLRPIKIECDVFSNALSSVFYSQGRTQVLCAVTLGTRVPHFLRGTGQGWLTAEYAMLPTAGSNRIQRDGLSCRRSGRSTEISRLISRSLRAIADLYILGERTINIDCDVLRADGGTRTACITAAGLALDRAQSKWVNEGIVPRTFLRNSLAAVSVGHIQGNNLLDLNYEEDSQIGADYNFILANDLSIIEIQGTAEKMSVSWEGFSHMYQLAEKGLAEIFSVLDPYRIKVNRADELHINEPFRHRVQQGRNKSLFSLASRGLDGSL